MDNKTVWKRSYEYNWVDGTSTLKHAIIELDDVIYQWDPKGVYMTQRKYWQGKLQYLVGPILDDAIEMTHKEYALGLMEDLECTKWVEENHQRILDKLNDMFVEFKVTSDWLIGRSV